MRLFLWYTESKMKPQLKITQTVQNRKFNRKRDTFNHILTMNQSELSYYLKQTSYQNPYLIFDSNSEVFEALNQSAPKLIDEILFQVHTHPFDIEDDLIAYLISKLNSNGYFKENLEEIINKCLFSKEDIINAINVLQTLEPIGCFCFDLKESLKVQCEMSQEAESETAYLLCDYLEEIAYNKIKDIEQALNLPFDEIMEGIRFLRQLNPKPASNYATTSIVLNPEVKISVEDDTLKIELLKQDFSLSLLEQNSNNELYNQASEIIACVNSRNQTLLKIMEVVCTIQKDYFLNNCPLKPCTLSQVSKTMDCHVSTISRAIMTKSFEFNHRYYPIRSLFVRSEQELVKDKIKELIENEDKMKPLSDAKIQSLLEQDHIKVSRRVVTKYREQCKIPSYLNRR